MYTTPAPEGVMEMLDRLAAEQIAGFAMSQPINIPAPFAPSHFVNIPKPQPKKPRKISQEEAWKLFGVAESVKMTFIPQVMTALALDWVLKFIDYCRQNRISEWKKHTRVLKQCVENYAESIRKSYGPAFPAYQTYVDSYSDEIAVDVQKMWFSIGNVANKQIPANNDREAATYLAIIHRLLDFVEEYDKKQDTIIAEKMGEPVHRKQDKMLQIITAMCIAIEEDFNLKLKPDPMFNLNMNVFANRASSLADRIIGEEGVKC